MHTPPHRMPPPPHPPLVNLRLEARGVQVYRGDKGSRLRPRGRDAGYSSGGGSSSIQIKLFTLCEFRCYSEGVLAKQRDTRRKMRRQRDRQTDRQRQAETDRDRQRQRETERQRETHRDTHTERHTHRETHTHRARERGSRV